MTLSFRSPISGPLVDEPVRAPAPVLDKATIDRREINRRAVKYWSTIRPMLIDMRGFSMIRHLGPDYRPTPNGRIRGQEGPRVSMLRGPSPLRMREV